MPDITSWLARLGLDKYAEAFTANEVDFDALQQRGRFPAVDHILQRDRPLLRPRRSGANSNGSSAEMSPSSANTRSKPPSAGMETGSM